MDKDMTRGATDGANLRTTSRAVNRGLLFFALTGIAVWAFGLLVWPFIKPIAWALCLAAISLKPYYWLAKTWRKPRLAAFVMTVVTALMVVGPIAFVSYLVLDEAQSIDLTSSIKDLEDAQGEWTTKIDTVLKKVGLPGLDDITKEVEKDLPAMVMRVITGPVRDTAFSVIMSPFVFLLSFAVMLATQYFIYLESSRLRRMAHDLSPLANDDTDLILANLRETTASAIIGTVLVAAIQGALGGIGFAIAGIQSPVMWSVVMAAASLIPFVGCAVVWVPAVIYLFATGDTSMAWFLLGWSAIVVGSADNFLRPWIMTKTGAKDIHPMLLFFAILSGIGLFGISGIVFGPLLLALLLTLVLIYREHLSEVPALTFAKNAPES